MDTKTKGYFSCCRLVTAPFHSAAPHSYRSILRKFHMCHSPSRSISYTLIASWVLSGRTSLAGSVCLLWIPGDTEWDDGCMGLMNGSAPATDMVQLQNFYSSVSVHAPHQNHFTRNPASRKKWCLYLSKCCDSATHLHLNVGSQWIVTKGRSQKWDDNNREHYNLWRL